MSKENLVWNEHDEVLRRRFHEALEAGMSGEDALLFAESSSDIGELRKIVRSGCPPQLIPRIVL